MIKTKYKKAFNFFLDNVKYENINWALTGSFRLSLENNELFNQSDIDILLVDYQLGYQDNVHQ